MTNKSAGSGLSRRTFLKASSQAAILLSCGSSLLAGCGGADFEENVFTSNSGGAAGGDLPSAVLTGRVDTSEIGGAGLRVVSAFDPTALVDLGGVPGGVAVDAGEEFSVLASREGGQLLFARDQNGALRAFGISVPNAGTLPDLVFNAESTALGLAFLTPGIPTSDPAEAATRLQELRALSEFTELVDFLRDRLPSSTIEALVALPELQALREALAVAWLAQVSARSAILGKTAEVAFITAGFKDETPGQNPARDQPIILSNSGYRFCCVVRQNLNIDGGEVSNERAHFEPSDPIVKSNPSILSGTSAFSVGNVVFGKTGTPQEAEEKLDVTTRPEITTIVFYVQGVGFRVDLDVEVPEDILEKFDDGTAALLTVVTYILAPLLDIVGGTNVLKNDFLGLTLAEILGKVIGNTALANTVFATLVAALGTDEVGYAAAGVDASLTVAGLLENSTRPLVKNICGILKYVAAGSATINVILAANHWARIPRYSRYELSYNADNATLAFDTTVVRTVTENQLEKRTFNAYLAVAADGLMYFNTTDGFEYDPVPGTTIGRTVQTLRIYKDETREEDILEGDISRDAYFGSGCLNSQGDFVYYSETTTGGFGSTSGSVQLVRKGGSTSFLVPPPGYPQSAQDRLFRGSVLPTSITDRREDGVVAVFGVARQFASNGTALFSDLWLHDGETSTVVDLTEYFDGKRPFITDVRVNDFGLALAVASFTVPNSIDQLREVLFTYQYALTDGTPEKFTVIDDGIDQQFTTPRINSKGTIAYVVVALGSDSGYESYLFRRRVGQPEEILQLPEGAYIPPDAGANPTSQEPLLGRALMDLNNADEVVAIGDFSTIDEIVAGTRNTSLIVWGANGIAVDLRENLPEEAGTRLSLGQMAWNGDFISCAYFVGADFQRWLLLKRKAASAPT